MQKKPHRRVDSMNFMGERNMQLFRKSLQHLRKPTFEERSNGAPTLKRNNSTLPTVRSPSITQEKVPGLPEKKKSPAIFSIMTASSNNTSKMLSSVGNNTSNLSDKLTKIKVKGIETPAFFAGGATSALTRKSPTSAANTEHLAQLELKNQKKTFVFPFKTSNKLIKIMSNERLKTPKKEERSSYNSKGEDRDSFDKDKKDLAGAAPSNPLLLNKDGRSSFFSIRSKNPPGQPVSKFEEGDSLGVPEGDSVIIDPGNQSGNLEKEKDKEKDNSLNKGKTRFSREEHKKINEILSSIVEKAQKEEESKEKAFRKSVGQKKSERLFEVKRIERESWLTMSDTRVLSCKFHQEDTLLAVGAEDGITRIMTANQKSIMRSLSDDFCAGNPANNVRWKPKDVNNVLLVTNINGYVTHWDLAKKKFINQIVESQNLYSADYNLDGDLFAIAGTDTTVKIYEVQGFTPSVCYQGHANRVYALKFHPSTPHLLLSGGWDETVLFWDIRAPQKENPINYLYGPLICGEALDISGDYILTGSWRDKQQLELWDMRKLQVLTALDWVPQKPEDKSYIYSAQISKLSQNYIIAGSSGASEIRIFQLRNEEVCEYECVEIVKDLTRSVYTLDFCHETNSFVYGDGNGTVGIVDIV